MNHPGDAGMINRTITSCWRRSAPRYDASFSHSYPRRHPVRRAPPIEFAPGWAPVALAILLHQPRVKLVLHKPGMDAIGFDLLNQRRHLRRAGLAL